MLPPTFQLHQNSNRIISAKALSHIYHPPFEITIALFQLVALGWQGLGERVTKAVGRLISMYKDAFRIGKALSEGSTCGVISFVCIKTRGMNLRISLHEDGMMTVYESAVILVFGTKYIST